jgi:hypothetical protein
MLRKNLKNDSDYPLIMTRELAAEFIGVSGPTFDKYYRYAHNIPVNDWTNGQTNIFDYKVNNTPISMLWRTLRDRLEMIKNAWSGYTILFLSNGGYFTMNMDEFNFSSDFSKFTSLTKKFHDQDFKDAEDVSTTDSKKSILIQLSDKLEKDGNIKIHNISGGTSKVSKKELEDMGVLDDPSVSNDPEVKKAALVNKMSKIASKSINADDAAKELENPEDKNDSDWLKDLLVDLQSEEGIKMNAARKSRMNQTKEEILTKEINGKTVGDLLKQFKENDDIPEESIPIETIDDNWKHVKFTNFNKVYDMEPDIVAMFTFFQNVTHPMNVLSINKENTSTSEDYKDTWTCKYEDAETGKRQTMKLDIPRMIGNRFMKLRGNEKVLIGQLMLLPIIKTGDDTVQVVSNYNKIFVTRKSPSGLSKSTPIVNKLCKVLDKYEGKNIIPRAGDNRKICIKYELPMEFVDISSLYAKIEFPKDNSYISFNMDDLSKIPFNRDAFPSNSPERKMTDEELNKKYLAVYVKDGKKDPIINQSFDSHILSIISQHDDEDGKFEALYRSTAVAKRLMYSEASILNTKIPVSVVLSYNIGLQRLLDKMKVNYEFSETRPAKGQSYIKFIDGYLAYSETTSSQNMMLNGLMECDFSSFSIKEINSKDMWLSILDNFGGRIKADGLDNFYDLMFDPITKEICNTLGIPGTYVEALIYANDLLIDNKFNKHTDVSGNRLRTNEVIVGHLYLILSKAFGAYRNMIKRNKGSASFSAKISAVIDSILNHDQTSSDLSTLTPLLEAEAASKVTFKGLSGMNSERAFSIDKRTYDKSMLGILGLSTGFASTVGINRQTTIDAGVINKRGFMKTRKPEELGNIKTFTVMEALSPMAVNHDDPIRTCMAFTQTVQHQMTVKRGMPNLVTTGCDEALPYITSDKFSYKFHGKKGTVIDLTDEYMVVQDDDTKQCDYVDLRELIQKNSDGGFYVTTKLDPIVKKGQKVRENDILAYDKKCYSNAIGGKGKDDNISYNIGTLGKVAIMDTDLGYEDSCVVDTTVSEALASEFVVQKEINIPKDSNVYDLVKIGQIVQEGDPLMVFQDSFDEKEANEFLKSISSDNETLSDLGRKQIHAKVTGVIQDIKIYRTCEINQLSETLQKVCKNYDTKINKLKSVMSKYGVDKQYTLESTGKLPAEGKPKPMYVEKKRMLNSARITCDFLGLCPGDTAFLCMSLDYIAGKMLVVRSLERKLNLVSVNPSGHPLKDIVLSFDKPSLAAMVPLQVYNSLSVPAEAEKLRNFTHLIIGGGAIDDELSKSLQAFPNNVWSTYGMTETLSHIALRRLNGDKASEWYTPFDSVKVSQNEEGCLVIDAPLVHDGKLITNDIVELKNGQFRILGRKESGNVTRHRCLALVFIDYPDNSDKLVVNHINGIPAAVRLENGKVKDSFQSLINPEQHIRKSSIAIHGITPEMVKDAPTEAEAMPKIMEFIGDYPIVAHNAIS